MYNRGSGMQEMILVLGLPESKIRAYLKSARAGYHTPAQQQEAEEMAATAKAERKVARRTSSRRR
jgi:hypothetical protein